MYKDCKWKYDEEKTNTYKGVNDSGIEIFAGTKYESLAREICQNSLDAVLDENKAVVIEFTTFDLPITNFPDYMQFKTTLDAIYNFWKLDEKAERFLNKAVSVINSDVIKCLRISDFNTTGVTGSEVRKVSNSKEIGNWNELVKSDGVSSKSGTSGGSFGIGKRAPFAVSQLRTIFYNTLDINGYEAFQGVTHLLTHTNENGISYKATAYFESENSFALPTQASLDKHFTRESTGTDIFIIGFDEDEDWEDRVIGNLLEDFIIPIYRNNLIININGKIIDNETLQNVIVELDEKNKRILKYAKNYYEVLTSEDTIERALEFNEMGQVVLKVLYRPEFHRKALMTRKSGMKLFDKDRIATHIYFAAIVWLEGEKINKYFREMESPSHTQWHTDRSSDKNAKKNLKMLNDWVKNTIVEIAESNSSDEIEVEGLGEFLPDILFDSSVDDSGSRKETISDKTTGLTIKYDTANFNDKNDKKIFDYDNKIDTYREESDEFSDDSIVTRENWGNSNDSDGGYGSPVEKFSSDSSDEICKTENILGMANVRIMKLEVKNTYKIIFLSKVNASNCILKLFASGENIKSPIKILKAYFSNNLKPIKCDRNSIKIGSITKELANQIIFVISGDENLSMEVNLYGHKN